MQCVSSLNSTFAFILPNKRDRNRKRERVRNSIVRYIILLKGFGYMIRYYYIAMYTASHKNIMPDAMSVLTLFNVPSCRIAKGSDDPVYLCSYHRALATRIPKHVCKLMNIPEFPQNTQ